MRLAWDDPRIRALNIPAGLGHFTLPDFGELDGTDQGLTDLPSVSADAVMAWQTGGQKLTGAVSVAFGWWDDVSLRTALEFLESPIADLVRNVMGPAIDATREAIRRAVDVGVGMLTDVISAVPIVGLVFEIAWNLGKAIVALVRRGKATEKPHRVYQVSGFSPEADDQTYKTVLDRALGSDGSQDMTDTFMPPGPPMFEQDRVEGGGLIVRSAGLSGVTVGHVPNTGHLHRAIDVWKAPGSSRYREADSGQWLPSARNQAAWLWSSMMKNRGPLRFAVHCEAIANAWAEYILKLRWYVEHDVSNRYVRSSARSLLAKPFGWGTEATKKAHEWGQPERWTPVHGARVLRARQLAALDTLTCAYVGPGAGALADVEVRERWEQRRRDLLTHNARRLVDLDGVPDREYRDALRRAGVGKVAGDGLAAPSGGASIPSATGIAVPPQPPLERFISGAHEPSPPPYPDAPTDAGKVAAAALGLAALVFLI